ncbi:MAG: class I SAM-dependent methyltransferase [Pseudomonadota bacterium]
MDVWEDLISLKANTESDFEVLPAPGDLPERDSHTDWTKERLYVDLEVAVKRDTAPLPVAPDREGYYGPHHFSYWASGLRDASNVMFAAERLGVKVNSFLDLGCASGRVIRHLAFQSPKVEVYGCDINRAHVDWVTQYLPTSIQAFHSHSIPSLPLGDNSLDVVTAFSVFTHIEAFETAWLLELRRVLRPGGIAWVTVHTEKTWDDMGDGWPLYGALKKHPKFLGMDATQPMPGERQVFRWRGDRSYSANVFYTVDYLKKNWGRFFEVAEFHRRRPVFQDVLVLRKRERA